MAWRISGNYYGPCSCNVGCPCALGELEADRGWCSGVLAFDIKSGNVDGLDVGGTKTVFVADWPSGFLAGNGKGVLYFDPGCSAQQRSALEQVLSGKKGGLFEMVASLVTESLPSKQAAIRIQNGGDETRITVGDVGEIVVKPLKGSNGQLTRLLNAAAGFREDIVLAKGTGTRWHDPDMRQWESGGHAEQADFDWSA
jgi:hypothetical protein